LWLLVATGTKALGRLSSPLGQQSGRSEKTTWLRCTVVGSGQKNPRLARGIGGWIASDKPRRALRSLLLGYYDRGKLIFAGKQALAST
jgi:hypothetical protein